MPRVYAVCAHLGAIIDTALVSGTPLGEIAGRFAISSSALGQR
jgi:hypothetical protein